MKNKDKFATVEEAFLAWKKFCSAQPKCRECKYEHHECILHWLYDEADDEPIKESYKLENNDETFDVDNSEV